MSLNVFRVSGDLAHISAKCILIWAMHRNQSAEGVSLLSQILYALVFVTRYLDLFRANAWGTVYNPFFKVFYLLSSFYTICAMTKMYTRTREKERAWKLALTSVASSLVLSPVFLMIFGYGYGGLLFTEVLWAFSIILEPISILPQLLLLRQTTVPTVIDSYYLLTLGSYRALYILNWLVRGFGSEKYWEPFVDLFGVIQTAFYIDFAWVYYSRQRIKLRRGGIVDREDFSRSWLVNKIISFRTRKSKRGDGHRPLHDTEVEDGADDRGSTDGWGPWGVSISADGSLSADGRLETRRTNGEYPTDSQ